VGNNARAVAHMLGPGRALATRELRLAALGRKPRGNFLAVIALYLDRTVLRGSARAAVALECLGHFRDLAFAHTVHETHRARAPSLACDPDYAVLGQARLGSLAGGLLPLGLRLGEKAGFAGVHKPPIVARHPRCLLRQARIFRLPNALRDMPRLCLFCGARSGRDRAFDPIVREVAQAIVRAGYGIVYGGGRVGLMGTLADAALADGGEVIGVIPEALERAEIAHTGITQLHVVRSMHERKALMADLSDGFIALPGGVGTMDEFCEILTWRQLGIHDKPIGLLNVNGFYDNLLALFDSMLEQGFLADPSRKLFVVKPTIGELLEQFA